jgi:2-phosphoglycerate kinase
MRYDPQLIVDHQNAESEIVWKATLGFVKDNLVEDRDVAVEGVAVLPHNLALLDFNYKAVIIVNLEDQTEVILRHAHDNPHDWLHKYDDDVILAFCNFNQELNKYYYREAQKYQTPIVNVDSNNFYESINGAIELLLNS